MARKNLAAARTLALEILNDPIYKENLIARAQDGELSPQMEQLLFHYAYGKPVEELNVSAEDDNLADMSLDELRTYLQELEASIDGTKDEVARAAFEKMPAVGGPQ